MPDRGGAIFHGYGSVSNDALNHLLRDHYLHRKPPMTHTFEWRKKSDCLAILTFGVPASRSLQVGACRKDPDCVIELNRLWISEDQPRGTGSWFIAQCLKDVPPHIIVSFADTKQGHDGTIYRASNFYYAGWTDMDRKTPRFEYQQTASEIDLLGDTVPAKHDRHISKTDETVIKVRRKPKARYWTVTGTKREKAALRKICEWPTMCWKAHPVPTEHQQINKEAISATP